MFLWRNPFSSVCALSAESCWDSSASICPTWKEEETPYTEHVAKTLSSKSEAHLIQIHGSWLIYLHCCVLYPWKLTSTRQIPHPSCPSISDCIWSLEGSKVTLPPSEKMSALFSFFTPKHLWSHFAVNYMFSFYISKNEADVGAAALIPPLRFSWIQCVIGSQCVTWLANRKSPLQWLQSCNFSKIRNTRREKCIIGLHSLFFELYLHAPYLIQPW